MNIDIRDKPALSNEDILSLNFIKRPSPYFFRNHYREGLRSRLMQVLDPGDVAREATGVVQDGMRFFPVAQPLAMFRIFKKKFSSVGEIQKEIDNYKLVQQYLPESHYAISSEFMVDYIRENQKTILLCGIQEYVPGEALDPWHENALLKFESVFHKFPKEVLETATQNLASFIDGIKQMVGQSGFIPDLAGVGNLILTSRGEIKIVDINNISEVSYTAHIPVDDKGYPVSDKSIQAIFQLERQVLRRSTVADETLYRFFLQPQRMKDVKELEIHFHQVVANSGNYPAVG